MAKYRRAAAPSSLKNRGVVTPHEYERNPNYFQRRDVPILDKLTVINVSDAGTASAAIKAGKIHATTAVTAVGVEDALKLEQGVAGPTQGLLSAHECGQPFFCQCRARAMELICASSKRCATPQINGRSSRHLAKAATRLARHSPWVHGTAATVEELQKLPGYRRPKDRDIADAKKLLQEAGYETPDKLGKRVLTAPTAAQAVDIAQLWAAQMRRNLGLEIEVKVTDTPTSVTVLRRWRF